MFVLQATSQDSIGLKIKLLFSSHFQLCSQLTLPKKCWHLSVFDCVSKASDASQAESVVKAFYLERISNTNRHALHLALPSPPIEITECPLVRKLKVRHSTTGRIQLSGCCKNLRSEFGIYSLSETKDSSSLLSLFSPSLSLTPLSVSFSFSKPSWRGLGFAPKCQITQFFL